jgi:HEPN domain-containing protein
LRREELAVLAIKRAERWFLSSKDALKGGRYDDAVYCAQMCTEHASKAVLSLLGVEYPKAHDVSDALMAVKSRMPGWFRRKLDEICRALVDLAGRRGLAGYGFEKGLEVSHFAEVAPRAVRMAEFTLENCKRFVTGRPRKGGRKKTA